MTQLDEEVIAFENLFTGEQIIVCNIDNTILFSSTENLTILYRQENQFYICVQLKKNPLRVQSKHYYMCLVSPFVRVITTFIFHLQIGNTKIFLMSL